jgi:hypothetical protein
MNPYFKTTKGYNAEVIVAKQVAYTTDATYADFVANAVEGEIGVFNADSSASLLGSASLAAPGAPTANISTIGGNLNNVHYFFKITGLNAAGETTGSTELDVNVTDAGDTNSIALTWPELAGATSYRVYWGLVTATQDKYYAVQDNSFDFVTAGGTAGTVPVANTATGAAAQAVTSGTKVFIAQKRDSLIHKTTPFKVESGIGQYTAYVAPVKEKWTIDTSGMTPVAGDVYEFAITELTAANPKYHVWNFDTKFRTGDTIATVVDRLVAQVNVVGGVNYAFGQIATATNTGNDIVLEAAEFGRFFKVSLRQALVDATVTKTTAANFGSGTADGIAALEAEGFIFDGVTTNYPGDGMANPEDYGKPTSFATAGVTYDTALFTVWAEEASPMPFHKHTHKKYILIALPASGTRPTVAFKTIFGF